MFDQDMTERRNRNIGLAIILAIIVFFWGNVLLRPLANWVSYLSSSVVYTNREVAEKTRLALSFSRSKEDLVAENIFLKRRINYLQSLASDSGEVVELKASSTRKVAKGRILSRPNLFPYDYLLVDLDDQNLISRVKPGQIVSYGNVGLGRVVTVYQTMAKVRLFSTPGTEMGVSVGTSSPSAKAVGLSGGNFVITMPRGLEIHNGDLVGAAVLPKGMLLGKVGFIDKSPSIPFQKVYFRYPLNLYEITSVDIHYE